MISCKGERQKKPMPFTKGPVLPEGICHAHGSPVTPQNLYLAQLSQRLGKEVLSRVGY